MVDKQVMKLQNALVLIPREMVLFSTNLRKLYNELQITEQDEATRNFIQSRDVIRKQAVIYSKEVLPHSENAIRSISTFMDYFDDLTFKQWEANLAEIIKDLEIAHGLLELQRQMHSEIVSTLKQQHDQAKTGIGSLNKMKESYIQDRERLLREAQKLSSSSEDLKFWGAIFAIPTLGISYVAGNIAAASKDSKAQCKLAQSTAKEENAEIAAKAADVTDSVLIPAIENFIAGLQICLQFLNETRENLIKMQVAGNKGKKEIYYITMKNRASEVSQSCMFFLTVTDIMRTDLAAIPSHPNDKNYVDKWLEIQMKKFQEEQRHHFLKLPKALLPRNWTIDWRLDNC